MRTVVHLSDLHFGADDPAVVAALQHDLGRLQPDVIAVSGDLTQRARNRQFASARTFLDALTAPLVVVPGNHDVPLYDLFRRFARPLNRFRRHIGDHASYVDEEVAVIGADTTRSLTIKDGGLTLQCAARRPGCDQRGTAGVAAAGGAVRPRPGGSICAGAGRVGTGVWRDCPL